MKKVHITHVSVKTHINKNGSVKVKTTVSANNKAKSTSKTFR